MYVIVSRGQIEVFKIILIQVTSFTNNPLTSLLKAALFTNCKQIFFQASGGFSGTPSSKITAAALPRGTTCSSWRTALSPLTCATGQHIANFKTFCVMLKILFTYNVADHFINLTHWSVTSEALYFLANPISTLW